MDATQLLINAAERKAQRFDDARLSATLIAGGLAACAVVALLLTSVLGGLGWLLIGLGCALFSAALTGAAVVLSAQRDAAREDVRAAGG